MRAVLLIDVMESVRLIEQYGFDLISRWTALVQTVTDEVVPHHGGRVVKSTGDGMLMDFPDVPSAAACGLAIVEASRALNDAAPAASRFHLRLGLAYGAVAEHTLDIFGASVNLAARLTGLAGPDELIASPEARDMLVNQLDTDIEDLGDCFVRNLAEPVRAYRVGPAPAVPVRLAGAMRGLRPIVAVVAPAIRGLPPDLATVGEAVAEEIIHALSRSDQIQLISRLSTTGFAGRAINLDEIRDHLKANYVVTGHGRAAGDRIVLDIELTEVGTGQQCWTQRVHEHPEALLRPDGALVAEVVANIGQAITEKELERARTLPLPNLASYTLLMSAITLMHRLSPGSFGHALELLQTLSERASRQALPYAWMAKWHVLRVQQGWTDAPDRDAAVALDLSQRALDADPQNSLALAVDGFVQTNLLKRLDTAQDRYQRALEANPSNALAWLLKGAMHAFMDDGETAVTHTARAQLLSPLDPHRYFFDALAAGAYIAAGRYGEALDYADRSLRANRTHTSTLRIKVVAHWHLGQKEAARAAAQELLRLEPALTLSAWRQRTPGADSAAGRRVADALRGAGVPA